VRVHPHYELMARFKYAHDFMHYFNPDTTLMYIDNKFTQQEIYTCWAQKVTLLKNWELSLPADFQWNTLQSNLSNFVQPQRYAIFLALATSYEVWRMKAQASALYTYVNDRVLENKFHQKNTNKITPFVALSCQLIRNEEFHISAFYKRAFRMPTFNDLYYTDIGNVALNPELTTQHNLGLRYTKLFKKGIMNAITLKTEAYYNKINDKIIAVPKGNSQYRWMMMNIGLAKIYGIESSAQLNWKFPYDIRMQTHFNYAYQKALDLSDPTDNDPVAGTYKRQIAYIPRHNGSFILKFTFKTYELNYSFIYVGERYHNSSNIRENYEQPWYTHDLSLGKEFRFKKWNFKVMAEISNLLNQQYEVVLNYPMPGTNFRMVLKFEI